MQTYGEVNGLRAKRFTGSPPKTLSFPWTARGVCAVTLFLNSFSLYVLLIIGPSYTIRKKEKSTKLNSLSLIKIMTCVDCLILDFVSFTSSLFYKRVRVINHSQMQIHFYT